MMDLRLDHHHFPEHHLSISNPFCWSSNPNEKQLAKATRSCGPIGSPTTVSLRCCTWKMEEMERGKMVRRRSEVGFFNFKNWRN
uniref:Uncharacterized protein n=1 Tax=Cannabis sativa TaxID=3483 RepID=A0A803RB41_CANSA